MRGGIIRAVDALAALRLGREAALDALPEHEWVRWFKYVCSFFEVPGYWSVTRASRVCPLLALHQADQFGPDFGVDRAQEGDDQAFAGGGAVAAAGDWTWHYAACAVVTRLSSVSRVWL